MSARSSAVSAAEMVTVDCIRVVAAALIPANGVRRSWETAARRATRILLPSTSCLAFAASLRRVVRTRQVPPRARQHFKQSSAVCWQDRPTQTGLEVLVDRSVYVGIIRVCASRSAYFGYTAPMLVINAFQQ